MNFHENFTEEVTTLNDYEIERDKPMPSRNHSLVQVQLSYILKRDYGKDFSFPTELDLEILPKGATPDICIYPKMKVNLNDDDVIKMSAMPITAVEILSSQQALNDLVSKARKRYFPNGVKSVWLVLPALQTITLISPDHPVKFFTEGKMTDPATGIMVDIAEAFDV